MNQLTSFPVYFHNKLFTAAGKIPCFSIWRNLFDFCKKYSTGLQIIQRISLFMNLSAVNVKTIKDSIFLLKSFLLIICLSLSTPIQAAFCLIYNFTLKIIKISLNVSQTFLSNSLLICAKSLTPSLHFIIYFSIFLCI